MTDETILKLICPGCGADLPPDAPRGYCLVCLFALGTAEPETVAVESLSELSTFSSQPAALRSFGDYELLEEIARGGVGIVYKARQIVEPLARPAPHPRVALEGADPVAHRLRQLTATL